MSLVEEITRHLLPEEKRKTVAVYAGGFKPPTAGHFEVVETALEKNSNIDEFIIMIGGKERDGISPEESLIIWDIYKQYLSIKINIELSPKPPIQAVYNYAKEHPDEDVIFVIGAREGNEEDFKDIANRTGAVNNYDNLRVETVVTQGGASGTAARNAAKISVEKLKPLLPKKLKDEEVDEIFNILSNVVKEELLSEMEQQELKYWALHFDLYQALTTGTPYKELLQKSTPDRKKALDYFNNLIKTSGPLKKNLTENASYSQHIDVIDKIAQLTNHMIDKGMNIEPLPSMEFIDGDSENAKDFFGKTAYYDPNKKHIVVYTEGRHPKDIVRSYAHEMIHHIQNLEDRLGDIAGTDTTSDEHLDKLEQEANLKGTMTFRNWTDSLNEDIKKINYTNPNFKDEWEEAIRYSEFKEMGIKSWIEIANKGYVTNYSKIKDKLGNVDLKFDSLEEPKKQRFQDALNKGNIEMSIAVKFSDDDYDLVAGNTRISGLVKNQIDPKIWVVDLSNSFDEGKNKDPFGLNAYARELAQGLEEEIISEGIYDSLVTRLTNITIKKWIADFKANPKIKQSYIDIDIDEEDSKGRPLKFNYVGQLKFDKKVGGYEVSGTSNNGKEDDKYAFIATIFKVNPEVLPNAWSKISADVSDVIRHEIEHLTQDGDNLRPGKYLEDDTLIRDMINKAKVLPKKNYYLLNKEVDAMLQGLYLKAKKTKKPFADVVNNYLDVAPGLEKQEDKEIILNLWRSRRKTLSLPVFENEKEVMDYKIYCDMDGVLADFESGYEKLTGIDLRGEFQKGDDFWDPISKAGVGFWAGLKWMPGGQELWAYLKPYDPVLLSAPSREESSRIGKAVWVKHKIPGTKLILRYAKQKQELATPESILIDDRQVNIDQWEAAGGIGILHTSTDNTISQLKELGL